MEEGMLMKKMMLVMLMKKGLLKVRVPMKKK